MSGDVKESRVAIDTSPGQKLTSILMGRNPFVKVFYPRKNLFVLFLYSPTRVSMAC